MTLATLELLSFIINRCGFKYLMTARLNQDSLEVAVALCSILKANFCSVFMFSFKSIKFQEILLIFRDNASGSNDHPDSQTFLHL